MKTVTAKPFLKWAGGKRALISNILEVFPNTYKKYYEPFLGGGAVFFAAKPDTAQLSDLNHDLITTYRQIKDHVHDVIELLAHMQYDEDTYYRVRAESPNTNLERAVRFIYLNRTCWNGLYRVNRAGRFNVPFGTYTNPKICDEENLLAVSKRLRPTRLRAVDFKIALKDAGEGDLVYLDPPYVTSHNNNGFIEYNKKIFSLRDQVRLAATMKELTQKGCSVLMSNANHKAIKEIYSGFYFLKAMRPSIISGTVEGRGRVSELIISNYPISFKNKTAAPANSGEGVLRAK